MTFTSVSNSISKHGLTMLLVWWRPICQPSRSLAALRCRQLGGSGSHAWRITGNWFQIGIASDWRVYAVHRDASISILQWHWIIMTASLPVYFRPKYIIGRCESEPSCGIWVRQEPRVWGCLRLHIPPSLSQFSVSKLHKSSRSPCCTCSIQILMCSFIRYLPPFWTFDRIQAWKP